MRLNVRLCPALLLASLGAMGCDLTEDKATLTVLYAAETTVPTDVFVAQKRLLDDALPGDQVLDEEVSASRVAFDLVPQIEGVATIGPRRYFDLEANTAYIAVVIGTVGASRVDLSRDTLSAVAFVEPASGTVRVVNSTSIAVDVTLGPPTMSPLGLPKTRLDGFGAVSAPVAFTPGHLLTVLDPSTNTVLYASALNTAAQTVVLGERGVYAF